MTMQTTLESPPTETEVIAPEFVMPNVTQGDTILWHKSGIRGNGTRAQTAIVLQVSGKNIDLWLLASKQFMPHVRHVDDPRLRLNEDHREQGGWEYTVSHEADKQWREGIESRLAWLEKPKPTGVKLPSPTKMPSNAGKGLVKYRKLKDEAKALGVEFKGNVATVWLQQEIDKVLAKRKLS